MFTRLFEHALIVSTLIALAGCAFLRGSAAGSTFIDAQARHLRLPNQTEPGPRSVVYRSPFEYQEYQHTRHNGRSEALFLRTKRQSTALAIAPRDLKALAGHWAFNRPPATLRWASGLDRRFGGQIRYRRFTRTGRRTAAARACVAFLRTWAVTALDPLTRPTKAYFGYHCAPHGEPLSAADARAYVAGISVTPQPLLAFHLGQSVPRDPHAAPIARGGASADWGLTLFPFNGLRHFAVGASLGGNQGGP